MEKIVKDGLRDCTVILDGSECAVRFDTCFRAFAVRNDGAADVFISKTSGIVPDADGVMCVKSGGSTVFAHMDIYANTVYLLGSGRVQVHAQNDSANPFNFAPTFDGGVQASGNPVIMDGLQGGVPFSEMVVSGKNLLYYPYAQTTRTSYGITFTDNGDGSITASGTHDGGAKYSYFGLAPWWDNDSHDRIFIKKGTVITYRAIGLPDIFTITMHAKTGNKNGEQIFYKVAYGENLITYTANQDCYIACGIYGGANSIGQSVDFTAYPQLEFGTTAIEYEPPITGRDLTVNVNGTEYTITPTSNPYIIPNDIRQQDGLNVVSVSEGELSVVGVRKNAAIKRIWDDVSMDLLFDGLALVASPAEIDLGNYSKYLINCYYNPDTTDNGHCISIVVEYDRLKNIVDKAGMLIHALYTSYALELHFSGTMDNANYYAKVNNNEASPYYTRIYGIK